MPKVIKSTRKVLPKAVNVVYEDRTSVIQVYQRDSSSTIQHAIYTAFPHLCGNFKVFHSRDKELELGYYHITGKGTVYVKRINPDADSKAPNRKGLTHKERIEDIIKAWGLGSTSEVFPVVMAPAATARIQERRPSTTKTTIWAFLYPAQWSKSFVHELHRLSQKTAGGHKEAIEMLRGVIAARCSKGKNAFVTEVTASDVTKAVRARNDELAQLAKEASETAMFADPALAAALDDIAEQPAKQEGAVSFFNLSFRPAPEKEE
ncbi:hypothetical protein BS50DRAFT_666037 [Corynespora cassiicola Philippines]|uniref:Uncharacterized protein n=1 Tax=Corynespora cassiicola Philippines TaxID=1448308 RepID=A0A2T2NSH8_CORCC|nr:hypothetical protein BS50DRAFT_666037 [Corynespora cassiicola Philippines]